MTQLTHIMRGIFYPSITKDPNVMMYVSQRTIYMILILFSCFFFLFFVYRDGFYTTIPWTKKTIVATWNSIFSIATVLLEEKS